MLYPIDTLMDIKDGQTRGTIAQAVVMMGEWGQRDGCSVPILPSLAQPGNGAILAMLCGRSCVVMMTAVHSSQFALDSSHSHTRASPAQG
jgi:hypothetical protein